MNPVTINEVRSSIAAPALANRFLVNVSSNLEEDVQRYQAILQNLISVNVAKIPAKNNFGLMVPTLATMQVQLDEAGTVLVALMSLLHTNESIDIDVVYLDAQGDPTSMLELMDCVLSDIALPAVDYMVSKPMVAAITFYVTTVQASLT